MKVFVYSKKDNHKIAVITDVKEVIYSNNKIKIIDRDGAEYTFDTKGIKTRIYQN